MLSDRVCDSKLEIFNDNRFHAGFLRPTGPTVGWRGLYCRSEGEINSDVWLFIRGARMGTAWKIGYVCGLDIPAAMEIQTILK